MSLWLSLKTFSQKHSNWQHLQIAISIPRQRCSAMCYVLCALCYVLCVLSVVRCAFFYCILCCVLGVVCCVLCPLCWMLFASCSVLCAVCVVCSLFFVLIDVCCVLCVVCYVLHAECGAFRAMWFVQCALVCSLCCVLCTARCVLWSLCCVLYSLCCMLCVLSPAQTCSVSLTHYTLTATTCWQISYISLGRYLNKSKDSLLNATKSCCVWLLVTAINCKKKKQKKQI